MKKNLITIRDYVAREKAKKAFLRMLEEMRKWLNEHKELFEESRIAEGIKMNCLLDNILRGANPEDSEQYKNLIESNVPLIYVFATLDVLGYVKVGYTIQHPKDRVKQWQKNYKDAHLIGVFSASVVCAGERFCFHDTDVHAVLKTLGFENAEREVFDAGGVYYCTEFFKNIDVTGENELFSFSNINDDVKIEYFGRIMEDIYTYLEREDLDFIQKKQRFKNLKKYADLIKETNEAAKILYWSLTDEQKKVVETGVDSIASGNEELLLAAIMRFGKSAVSYRIVLDSFLPAEDKGSINLIVSGKDTRETWQRDFFHKDIIEDYPKKNGKGVLFMWIDGKDFRYCGKMKRNGEYEDIFTTNGKKLRYSPGEGILEDVFKENTVFFYVSFQDAYGDPVINENGVKNYRFKTKHSELFGFKMDAIIIDETHYGARSSIFGGILYDDGEEKERFYQDESLVKPIECKIHLHLSATPYKILASKEFLQDKHAIIGIITLADIYRFKQEWDEKHPESSDSPWENPYFGTPEFHQFMLNVPEEIRSKIVDRNGNLFDKLFEIDENTGEFVYTEEILLFFKSVFGSIEDKRSGLVNNRFVEEQNVMKHIVIVLNSIAACDNLRKLLIESGIAENGNYIVFKLTGKDRDGLIETETELNKVLFESDKNGHRTITLTCDKFTTGATVNLWDTMLYLKDGDSAELYDQTWGRILSRAVVDLLDQNNEPTGEKVCIKNHVYFFDFKPNRAVEINYDRIESLARYFESTGDTLRAKQVRSSIERLPLVNLDDFKAIDTPGSLAGMFFSDKFETINRAPSSAACDIVKYIPESIFARYGVDLNAINKAVKSANPGTIVVPITDELEESPVTSISYGDAGKGNGITETTTKPSNKKGDNTDKKEKEKYKKQVNAWLDIMWNLAMIMPEVSSIKDMIHVLQNDKSGVYSVVRGGVDKFVGFLMALDNGLPALPKLNVESFIKYKNLLVNDSKNYSQVERARSLISGLRNLTSSEVVTPSTTARVMLHLILNKAGVTSGNILDFCTYGEFILEMFADEAFGPEFTREYGYVLPGSKEATVFVEKLFDILGLDKSHILYDIDIYNWTDEYTKKLKAMRFKVAIGNPPYQIAVAVKGSKNGQQPVVNIFQKFQEISEQFADYTCLIYPGARWIHRSGKGLSDFGLKQINDVSLERVIFYPVANEVFENVEIPDGLTIVTKDVNKTTNGFEYSYVKDGETNTVHYDNPGEELIPLNPIDLSIVNNVDNVVKKRGFGYLKNSILPRNLFSVESNFVEENPHLVREYSENSRYDETKELKIFTNDKAGKSGRAKWYIIDRDAIETGKEYIDKWKVVASSASPAGQKRDNQLDIIDNHSVFGRSRIAFKTFDTKKEADNFYAYMKSEPIRFLLLMTNENLTSLAKRVPDILDYSDNNGLIDFSKDINSQLYELLELDESQQKYIRETLSGGKKKQPKNK